MASHRWFTAQLCLQSLVATFLPCMAYAASCSADAVFQGETATVVCSLEVTNSEMGITIEKYKPTLLYFQDTMLHCYKLTDDKRTCTPKYGYEFGFKPNGQLFLRIVNATLEDAGDYACQSVPSQTRHVETCNLKIKRRGRSTLSATENLLSDSDDVSSDSFEIFKTIIGVTVGLSVFGAVCYMLFIKLEWRPPLCVAAYRYCRKLYTSKTRRRNARRKGRIQSQDHNPPISRMLLQFSPRAYGDAKNVKQTESLSSDAKSQDLTDTTNFNESHSQMCQSDEEMPVSRA